LHGPGSSVAIATELRAGRSGDRIPLGRDFPSFQTGAWAHPAPCTMGTGSFPGVNYGRVVLLTPYPLLVPWSWNSRAIPLPTLGATTGAVTGTLYTLSSNKCKERLCLQMLLLLHTSEASLVLNICELPLGYYSNLHL
jgi:hypothetical protein